MNFTWVWRLVGCGAHTGRPEVTSTSGGSCQFPRSGDPRSRCGGNSPLPGCWWVRGAGLGPEPARASLASLPGSARAERFSDPGPCGSRTSSGRKQHTAFISSRCQIAWGTSVANHLDFFQIYIYYHHNQDIKLFHHPQKFPQAPL